MAATVATVAYLGLEARAVEVQVQLSSGLAAFVIVGLPDKAVAESRERVRAAAPEVRAWLHRQHNASKGKIELRALDLAASDCRIVDFGAICIDPLQYDEMIEVPEENCRHRQIVQRLRLLAKTFRFQSKTSCRLQKVAGLAAVTGYAARDP